MENVPEWVWGTRGGGSLGSTQPSSAIKVRNRGDLPWTERTASRWQSWPSCPSGTTWSSEPAAPKTSPRFPFPRPDTRRWGRSPLPGHSVSGAVGLGWHRARTWGRCPRKHTGCNVNRPDFSDSKVHFGTMLEPSRANETGVECIYFYTATNYQITLDQINYDPTNASWYLNSDIMG